MWCNSCSERQRKAWVFGSGTLFAILGVLLIVFWPRYAEKMVQKNLELREGTETYKSWVEAPIPIYLEFTLFNWTNPEQIRKKDVKPKFVEMGPYVFLEKHLKENFTFHDNHTVDYYEKRTWFFMPELSNGSLSDLVTAPHVITATMADETRTRNKYIKKVINFMLNYEGGKLFVTKPVKEWIFDGFQDDLIDFLKLLNGTVINMPYSRFGWLVDRNDSMTYDGRFTIHTGTDDISNLGQLIRWNGQNQTTYFDLPCGAVNGSTGDLFPPNLNTSEELTIFATDTCRYMNLKPHGTTTLYGITATKWMGTNETLDSGENYESQKCFCNPKKEECPKTGVVDCKKCRNSAPIYASFPHFYLADETYLNGVDGLRPDEHKHQFSIAIEPRTGLPLDVNARIQINMLLEPDDDYDIYRGVPKVMMPLFWFNQKATLSPDLAQKAKLAINLASYGVYTGIGCIVLALSFVITGIVLTVTKLWKRPPQDDEDLLTN